MFCFQLNKFHVTTFFLIIIRLKGLIVNQGPNMFPYSKCDQNTDIKYYLIIKKKDDCE